MYKSKFHLERIEELPDEAYWNAMEDFENQKRQRLEASRKYHSAIEDLRKKYLNELHSLIGEKNLPQYLNLHNRRIKNMRSLREKMTLTSKNLRQIEEKRLHNIKETAKLAKKAGIDEQQIRALQKEFSAKYARLFQDRIGKLEKIPFKSPPVPRGDDWITLTSPYQDHDVHQLADSTKGPDSYSYDAEVDQWSGRMRHESSINIKDADDSDNVSVESRIDVGKVVQVPSGCHALSVLASFENIQSSLQGQTYNECGWSYYHLHSYCGGSFRVFRIWPMGGGEEKHIHVRGVGGGSGQINLGEPSNGVIYAPWEIVFWAPGEAVYTPPVHFQGPYSPGDYLAVWSGLQIYHTAWVNDFSVTMDLRYELKLKNILVNFR